MSGPDLPPQGFYDTSAEDVIPPSLMTLPQEVMDRIADFAHTHDEAVDAQPPDQRRYGMEPLICASLVARALLNRWLRTGWRFWERYQ